MKADIYHKYDENEAKLNSRSLQLDFRYLLKKFSKAKQILKILL